MLFKNSRFNKLIYSDLHFQLISWFKTPAFLAEGRTKEQTIDIQYASLYWAYSAAKYGNFFNIYVYFFFFLFLIIHAVTLPIYLITLFIKVLQNIFNIWVYKHSQESYIQLNIKTKYIESHWLEFMYYSTYHRAEVTAFNIIYTTLKLCVGKVNKADKSNLLPLILKVFLTFTFRLLWSVVFHTPLKSVTRSYKYASVFWEVKSFKQLNMWVIHTQIINNYIIGEMGPTLRFRIYRLGDNPWNFNPHILKSPNASTTMFYRTEFCHPYIFSQMKVQYGTYPGGSLTKHFGTVMSIGESNGREVCSKMHVTSGIKTDTPAYPFAYFCNSESRTFEQTLMIPRSEFNDQFIDSKSSLNADDIRVRLENRNYFSSLHLSHIIWQGQLPIDKILQPGHDWYSYQEKLPCYDKTNILNPTRPLYLPGPLDLVTEVQLRPELLDIFGNLNHIFNDTSGIIEEVGKGGVDEFINLFVQKYSPDSLNIVSNIRSSEAYSNYIINPYDITNNI